MITLRLKYESQRIAYQYLALGLIFFGLQIVFGLLTGAKYVWDDDPLRYLLPFNTTRALHINLLVIWLLMGFMGATYYLIPEETQSEIFSPLLARIQLWLMAVITLAAAASYLLGWSWGMPFLEQPLPIKLAIVVAALIFLYNIFMTAFRARRWTVIQGVLIGGLVMLALMFLAGIFFMKNLTTQYFYWWWVIHLWVEGAWELVAGAITAYILLKLTGVERSFVEKWLYVEVGLVLFTGIAGTGHHYYWIGTPGYWLWVGGIFSALEPVPILLMVIDTVRHVRERRIEVPNRLALNWVVASTAMHFIGAGVWGFAQTLPAINRWTHGTQITASHGHFAFFGAYAMINLAMITLLLPQLRGRQEPDAQMRGAQGGAERAHAEPPTRMGAAALWLMVGFMVLLVLSLAVAGVVQVYFNRVLGLDFMTTQGFMRLWFICFWISAWGFTVGAALFIWEFFTRVKAVRVSA